MFKRVYVSTCNIGDWIWWGVGGALYPAVILEIDNLSEETIPTLIVLCEGQVCKQTSLTAIKWCSVTDK